MNYELISPINPEYSVVEQILTNRGIAYKDIEHYLHTSDNDILDPSLLDNIDRAAQILISHLGDKIFVQIDSDCDGFTSAAVLLNYLHRIVPTIVESTITYSFHSGKQHGIDLDYVPDDVKLVIAPDSSSNDYDIHKQLAERGIDVLVLDHHEADRVSEYACVVNNQLCDYPTKSLSGVGIVYKLCQYCDTKFGFNYSEDLIDLVALGLIADMMSLHDFETRHMITCGLQNVHNPFLAGMCVKNSYSIGDELTPIGIAFYVAPYINAVNRVGTEEEKRILFEAMLEWKAYESIPSTKRGCQGQFEKLVDQAVRTCINIKSRQTKSRDASLDTIENLIEAKSLLDHKILAICLDSYIDRNLSGLIANEISNRYQRPVFILSDTDDGWMGSARNCGNSKLSDLKAFVQNSGYSSLAEGHANAFGIGFPNDDAVEQFVQYADTELANFDFSPSYKVDFIYSAKQFKANDILEIGYLKRLWGQDVGEAMIALENVPVSADNIQLMSRDKNPTLKITLPNGVACIKFKSNEEEYNTLYTDSGCVFINLVGTCGINEWMGMITPQIYIENFEIVKRQEYYF